MEQAKNALKPFFLTSEKECVSMKKKMKECEKR